MAQGTSETADVKTLLAPWCKGHGLDVGFGGEKIVPHAIAVDLPEPYMNWGKDPLQLGGDAAHLYWFQDSCLDFVYSSHMLEDFEDPLPILNEFARVLKLGGHLVLYLPDEQLFRKICASRGQPLNLNHKHEHFGSTFVKQCVDQLYYPLKLTFESGIIHDYSFAMVFKKTW